MANQSIQLTKDMHCWLKNHACRPSTVMATLCKKTMELEQGQMLTSPEQLQFLAFLAKSICAKNTIEVGVYTGASTLAIAEVLPENGTVIACDLTEEFIPIASPAWKEAGVSNVIDLRIGAAIDTLNTLLDEGKANTFDFMYIDADKLNSRNYYELGLELVSSGGIIAIDNMFYGGQVIDDDTTDENTIATRELADFLITDNRIDYTLLPIGDGLALARVL